uniref:Uncharacterized protein n=1 Tax=Anabas testudineus TaxID=64144 RepID=A0A3Q1JWQ1_ANATE
MKAHDHGHIMILASVLSLFSTARVEDYCASKFAAVGFYKSLAHELLVKEVEGVQTTLLCPYIVDTGMFEGCKINMVLNLKLEKSQLTMNAALIDQPLVTPLHMFSFRLLPWESNWVVNRFMGSDKCMYPFIETMKKEAFNGTIKGA